ncbi:hypothetical protein [Kribbella sp. NPDC004875]
MIKKLLSVVAMALLVGAATALPASAATPSEPTCGPGLVCW